MPRLLSVLPLSLSLIPLAAAAEPRQLIDISVKVVDEGQVRLELTYPGGACDRPGKAQVSAATNSIVSVEIPVTRTSEVCTDQIVPVHFAQIVAIEPGTQQIAATVIAPDGQKLASGSVDIDSVAPPAGSAAAGE